ncbi:non-homologous end-joining DNA ligase [Rhodococcus sp. UNC363MFTsu5.1]|uniref:non-homologous end-joining DNA ligase n=1 Tax=Rhodococcus sp. UNC363MFTsu5.1 TaxID=1449069 RepID=UPI000563C2E3|nr:non-homologous end-joining DNA ligase [Rhodococcus sp. UNC363MFTsu5.1]
MSHNTAVMVEGKRLSLTNLDKVLYPETGTTKAEILQYFTAVGPLMVPLLAGRPVTRKRWPDGVSATPFFQKNVDASTPDWVDRRTMTHSSKTITYPIVDDLASLVYFAQAGSLEFHVPQWRFGAGGVPMDPDRLVIDLDPGPGVTLEECAEVALRVRDRLADSGLGALPVTSGSKGIHLYAGIGEGWTAARCVEFAKKIAVELERETPTSVISKMTRAERAGKVFVDWSQNSASKTTVSPYSLRGTASPNVAAPRTWDELTRPGLRQLDFHEVLDRISEGGAQPGIPPAPAPERARPQRRSRAAPTGDLAPMLASAVTVADFTSRADPEVWALEPKLDGIRALVHFDHDAESGVSTVRLVSRSGSDLTPGYPELLDVPEGLHGHSGVLDGEIVVLGEDGAPSFGRLQQRMGLTKPRDVRAAAAKNPVLLEIFDVLQLDGTSLRAKVYRDRRRVLDAIRLGEDETWRVLELAPADLGEALESSRTARMEGLVAKRWDSTYRAGRSASWLKLKHYSDLEVVVGGWQQGEGRRAGGVGSLLLGVPGGADGLRYVGKVGTGFSDATLTRLARLLADASADSSPFGHSVPAVDARAAHWVRPEIVGEVRYSELTGDGRLRHPSWRGLRPDKDPDQVAGLG